MSSLFTKIIQGEIPCHKVAESDTCFAFMDIRPVQNGHVLVVPKVEVDRFFDLSADQLADIMAFAQQVAGGIEQVFPCDRVGMSVIGLRSSSCSYPSYADKLIGRHGFYKTKRKRQS